MVGGRRGVECSPRLRAKHRVTHARRFAGEKAKYRFAAMTFAM